MTSPMDLSSINNTPSDPPVGNSCGGFWITTAGGDVCPASLGILGSGLARLLVVGDGFPWIQQIVEAKNPQITTEEV